MTSLSLYSTTKARTQDLQWRCCVLGARETVTCIPSSRSLDLAALARWSIYTFSTGDLNSPVACNNLGLVTMSAQFLLLVHITRSLEKQLSLLFANPSVRHWVLEVVTAVSWLAIMSAQAASSLKKSPTPIIFSAELHAGVVGKLPLFGKGS
jgi:hypothetical protein